MLVCYLYTACALEELGHCSERHWGLKGGRRCCSHNSWCQRWGRLENRNWNRCWNRNWNFYWYGWRCYKKNNEMCSLTIKLKYDLWSVNNRLLECDRLQQFVWMSKSDQNAKQYVTLHPQTMCLALCRFVCGNCQYVKIIYIFILSQILKYIN